MQCMMLRSFAGASAPLNSTCQRELILYSRLGDVDEQEKHKIRKDFFDDETGEREFKEDEYSKYKN